MNYESAMSKLRTARRIEDGKPIANNTRLMLRGESVAVKLHNTDVVTFHPDRSVTLNSGGWKTKTTSDRINNASPYGVYSNRGTWFVTVHGKSYVFCDGMRIAADGEVIGAGGAEEHKRQQALRRDAGNYASRFVNALYRGNVPLMSNGDCMICRGRVEGDSEHIISHMEKNYYVPSLLHNALTTFGASIAAQNEAMKVMANARKLETLADALAHEGFSAKRHEHHAKQMQKCIRRYVLHQFGLST